MGRMSDDKLAEVLAEAWEPWSDTMIRVVDGEVVITISVKVAEWGDTESPSEYVKKNAARARVIVAGKEALRDMGAIQDRIGAAWLTMPADGNDASAHLSKALDDIENIVKRLLAALRDAS